MSGNPLPCPRCQAFLPEELLRKGGTVVCPGCNSRLVLKDASPNKLVWYFSRENRDGAGPFSWVQLRQLAEQGLLLPTDLFWRSGMRQWVKAEALPGLFPSAAAARSVPLTRDSDAPPLLDSESILGDSAQPAPNNRLGPLSRQGMRARPRGAITLGDFQILKKIGAGAMGAVYLARQRSLNLLLALKVLSKTLAAEQAYVRRFLREAAVLERLKHPHIVRFHGVGEEKGLHYLAMEYIDGFTLASLLERRGGRLAVGDALYITLAVARALEYAHECGIVHRDVKPTNILVSRQSHVKITDLGLAKPVDEDLSLTVKGTGVGTPQYMAPEQCREAQRADLRSDIYALGGVLYQMVTGVLPFQGESAPLLMQAKEQGQFPSARRLNEEAPARLDLMIDKMLARDVRDRYQTCTELIRDLDGLGLTNGRLSFNPLDVAAGPPSGIGVTERAEILLIEDDADDILLAQEALERNNAATNLSVLGGPAEALAFLRRQGKYVGAPRPGLIILGRNLLRRGGLETITAVKADEALRDIPLVVLTTAADAVDLFGAHGLEVGVKLTRPADLVQFQDFLTRGAEGSTVMVVQLPPGP